MVQGDVSSPLTKDTDITFMWTEPADSFYMLLSVCRDSHTSATHIQTAVRPPDSSV